MLTFAGRATAASASGPWSVVLHARNMRPREGANEVPTPRQAVASSSNGVVTMLDALAERQ